jgi:hypothetical protein
MDGPFTDEKETQGFVIVRERGGPNNLEGMLVRIEAKPER